MLKRKYKGMAKSADKVDKNKPNGNASVCINCGKCLEKCPQHIEIPTELKKTHAILGKRKKILDYYQ